MEWLDTLFDTKLPVHGVIFLRRGHELSLLLRDFGLAGFTEKYFSVQSSSILIG